MKKAIQLTGFLFAVVFIQGQAPTFDWVKVIRGEDKTSVFVDKSMVLDSAGNLYAVGDLGGPTDFDPGPGVVTHAPNTVGFYNMFILKLDPMGNFVWVKTMGGDSSDVFAHSIALDATGNICVTGEFNGTIDFDPGAGTQNISSASWSDVFVLKLDPSGNFTWVKKVSGSHENHSSTVAVGPSSSVYVTGYFIGTTDFDPGAGTANFTSATFNMDLYVLKLDASGNFIWVKTIGGTGDDFSYSMDIDASENIYTTGSFHQTVDFDPGAGITNLISTDTFYSEAVVMKMDGSGNMIWAKSMGGVGAEYGVSLTLDPQDNVYTTGTFSGTADFDPGAATYILNNGGMFISKLDPSGNFVWARGMKAGPTAIALDHLNSVYTIGTYVDTVDFDPGAGVANIISNTLGIYALFISKLDASGDFVWVQNIGGFQAMEASSILVDEDYNIYTSGKFTDTVDFNPGAGVYILNDTNDVFIHKMTQDIIPQGLKDSEDLLRVYIFPNPATDVLTIQSKERLDEIIITNVLGNTVLSKTNLNNASIAVDISSFTAGIYFVSISGENGSVIKKIIRN